MVASFASIAALGGIPYAANTPGSDIPGPLPIFPPGNWWNLDISTAPVDPGSASYIAFIGSTRPMHPDFGGDVSPDGDQVYGFPYAVVDGTVTRRAVQFYYADQSDGVNHTTNTSIPFYPIPDEAITQAHWIESGEPGNVDLRDNSDRPRHGFGSRRGPDRATKRYTHASPRFRCRATLEPEEGRLCPRSRWTMRSSLGSPSSFANSTASSSRSTSRRAATSGSMTAARAYGR